MTRTRYLLAAILILFTMTGCSDFELKTRDDLRGEESHSDKKPASTTAASTAAPTPVPEDLEAQMRSLNGRVDEAESYVKQLDINMQVAKDEASKQNQARDQKQTALEEEIKKLEAQVQGLSEQVNKPKPVAAADPASYMTEGDDLVTAKKNKEAIVAYQKYRDALPKGGRYAEATYKIGVSFQELGMKDESKAFYEEVMSKFPKSSYAKNAAKKLKTLK